MNHIITGLFQSRAAAETVAAHLATHDAVARNRMGLHAVGEPQGMMQSGVWASLWGLVLPKSGGAILLTAEVEGDLVSHALEVFERHGAVDLDAQQAPSVPARSA